MYNSDKIFFSILVVQKEMESANIPNNVDVTIRFASFSEMISNLAALIFLVIYVCANHIYEYVIIEERASL